MVLLKKRTKTIEDKKLSKSEKVQFEQILKIPHISEKATDLTKNNHYIFRVSKEATKNDIKKAIEELYRVEVLSVKTIRIPPKKRGYKQIKGWKKGIKKAIVKLKKGQKIEILPTGQ